MIIAAHNEFYNLKKFLPSILTQDFRLYEVIVVLDRCTDKSEVLLNDWKKQYPHLRIVVVNNIPNNWAPKKWAVSKGIETAVYEHLALTDADCRVRPSWLKHIADVFVSDVEVILGLGLYERHPGLLNTFIRFETFYAAFQYVGMALQGKPYMGVGRNLAYTKSFFQRNNGLEAFQERLSGDDDLLVNAYAEKRNTTVMLDRESFSLSVPEITWKRWFYQKFRHLSASSAYSVESQTLLGIFHASHACFYAGILVSLSLDWTNSLIYSLYAIRVILSWLIFVSINKTIQEEKFLYLYPFLDIMFFMYNLIVVPIGMTRKPEWKKQRN